MIVGTTLFKLDGTAFDSPPSARQGLAAVFAVDVTHTVGSPTVTITIEHRDQDATSWETADALSDITRTGTATKEATGLKEVLRFKYSFAAGDDATDGAHFFMQAPSWRPYA